MNHSTFLKTIVAAIFFYCALRCEAQCNINNTGATFERGNSVYGVGASFILGRSASYAALASAAITNVGLTVLTGDIGVYPGSSINGFGPGTYTGEQHAADSFSQLAQDDLIDAYNLLAGLPCNVELTGTNLGGLVLAPGVYKFSSSAELSNVMLTLQGTNNPTDAWVFQIASTLTTDSQASVILTNGGRSSNVFWQLGSASTLGTGTALVGSLLAYTSVTLNSDAILDGRALALNGQVTLGTSTVTVPNGGSSVNGSAMACNATFPLLQSSSDLLNASSSTLDVICQSASCPDSASKFAGLPYKFSGEGAGDAICSEVTSVTVDGFTCQISGTFSAEGGDVYLFIYTNIDDCFGESTNAVVASVLGEESSSGLRLLPLW